jgi:hypothetical protein
MTRSEIYEFLRKNDFVKSGHHSTSTGFGFTETNEFSKGYMRISVCECDEEKTVIRVEKKGVSGMTLPNTNLNKVTTESLEQLIKDYDNA